MLRENLDYSVIGFCQCHSVSDCLVNVTSFCNVINSENEHECNCGDKSHYLMALKMIRHVTYEDHVQLLSCHTTLHKLLTMLQFVSYYSSFSTNRFIIYNATQLMSQRHIKIIKYHTLSKVPKVA